MSVLELQSAVSSLSPEELAQFSEWFENFCAIPAGPPHLAVQSMDDLRAELQVGLDQLDRGEGVEWDPEAMKARIKARVAARNGVS